MAVETRMDAAEAVEAATPPVNVTMSTMYLFIPTIPDANPEEIEQRFKYSTLTKNKGGADYERMCVAREEIFRNAIAINSTFVEGNHGHLGSVSNPALYHT